MTGLPDETRIGKVGLTISDLDRSIAFYTGRIGMDLMDRRESTALLGAGGRALLELHEIPGATRAERTTGLYHFAILVPARYDLARSLHRIAETRTPVQGFADHLVSEAIYLPDPDGNGIEIYRDRPRGEWPLLKDGSVRMDNAPLDLDGLLSELGENPPAWTGLHADTVIGHMHLHVSDLEESEPFYRSVIGLDLMMRFGPSALFLSAGGYHHHLGINTWAGVGAPPPPLNSVGLRWFEVLLPDEAALQDLVSRLAGSEYPYETFDQGIAVRDPAKNTLKFLLDPAA